MGQYMSDDITFCSSQCDRVQCYRHPQNIRHPENDHSFADLKGSQFCEARYFHAEVKKKRGGKRGRRDAH